MRMIRKEMHAHARMNAGKGGTTTPAKGPSSLNLNDMKTVLEEQRNEMNKAMSTLPKTLET